MFKIFSLIATIFFIVTGVLLGVLNPTPIKLDLFLLTPTLPLSMIMAIMFILGLIIGALLITSKMLKVRWVLAKEQKHSKKQANQIIELKKQLSSEKEEKSSMPALKP